MTNLAGPNRAGVYRDARDHIDRMVMTLRWALTEGRSHTLACVRAQCEDAREMAHIDDSQEA